MPVAGDQGAQVPDPWVRGKASTSTSSVLLPVKLEPDFVLYWEGKADLVVGEGFRGLLAVTGKRTARSDEPFNHRLLGGVSEHLKDKPKLEATWPHKRVQPWTF